jgi:hypothetical protein
MKVLLAMLTTVNIALTVFGVSLAMMSPMMFDGGDDGKLLWAIFWSLWISPSSPCFACSCLGSFCGCNGPAPRSSRPPSRSPG